MSETPSLRIHDLPAEDRPREKLAARGAGSLTDAELLAIFFRVGGRGVNAVELGRHLIKEFGSLREISRATVKDLQRVKGVGPAKAAELSAAFELGGRLAAEKFRETRVDSPEAVCALLGPEMTALSKESLRVVLLNTRHCLIRVEEVALGSLNETVAHPREILKPAISYSAFAFILVHNHPSGDTSPSESDRALTRRLAEGADYLQIRFLDHVILGAPMEGGGEPYFSFREMGLL